jgi:hypothetical protein
MYSDEYEYLYSDVVENVDDLYDYYEDNEDDYSEDAVNNIEWENYYHNLADDIVDE